jgi:hypothetical protein
LEKLKGEGRVEGRDDGGREKVAGGSDANESEKIG